VAVDERFSDLTLNPAVRGFLRRPVSPSGDALVLTHGAGGNAQMSLLVALAEAFAGAGFTVLRCDLPFRQLRRFGPPRPGDAAQDRSGLKNAMAAMRTIVSGRVFLGGQSYGGRQASMLLAEERPSAANSVDNPAGLATLHRQLADGLLLLSYPLHAPGRPDQPRTQHLPKLQVPTLFVHGTRDPFGSIEELEAARKLIPAATKLLVVDGAGHDLGFKAKAKREELPGLVLVNFRELFG
jgi:predicted alpha/beta-hydrolase family hydrolase